MTRLLRSALVPALAVLLGTTLAAPVVAQTDTATLRRDQEEIVRKAERLQALMQRLLTRYQREGRKEQVDLLQQGLAHLEQSGVLKQIAGVRDDLVANALSEAQRKQQQVITDLEHLIDILLERKSVENLDAQLARTEAMARDARALEKAQRDLRDRTQQTMQARGNPTEQKLQQGLQQLQLREQAEAKANARDAGQQRPVLEDALQRTEQLLQQQTRLEQEAGKAFGQERRQEQQRWFDLRELQQRARQLQAQLRGQDGQQELQRAAEDLQQALQNGDRTAVQQQKDRLQAKAENAPKLPGDQEGPRDDKAWQEVKEGLQQVADPESPAGRDKLAELAKQAAALAAQRQQEGGKRSATDAEQLAKDAARTGEQLAGGEPPKPDSAAAAVQKGQQELEAAAKAARAGDQKETRQRTANAQQQFEAALERQKQEHPDPEQQAGSMAADSKSAADALRNTPSPEALQQQAGEALQQASQALRQAQEQFAKAQEGQGSPAEVKPQLDQSRRNLEAARADLQRALQQAAGESQQGLQQAQQRQQELRQAAEALQQQVQQAQQQGELEPAQAKPAGERLQQAQQAMQRAEQRLQEGKQASAAGAQQEAAKALQQAQEEMAKNRKPDAAQQEALQQEAKDQQQLADDIVRLAEELKKQEQKRAQRAAEDAAEAAKKAQRALQQNDPEQAEQQQEEARKQLDRAAKELEEERDRYQDLRQEELLFRMKEELQTLLDKQQPITQQTLEVQKQADKDGVPRAARRKLNQFGEQEQELAAKVDFVVKALVEEGNLVFQTVLKANAEDLRETARRLGGRNPDPGSYTTMLQQDVERRTRDLIAALDRERQRREQERKDQEQQQQKDQEKGKNRFNPQQQRLVSMIADLQMLKQLELDTRKAAGELETLLSLAGDAGPSQAESALVERLSHRHGEISAMFRQVKAQMEEMLQQMQEQEGDGGHAPEPPKPGKEQKPGGGK